MINERIALGLPSLAGYDIISALKKAQELGFQSIMSLPGGPNANHSLGQFPTLDFYERSACQLAELRDLLEGFRHVSIHQAWDNNWRAWIDCASYFGAKIVTVHPPQKGNRLQKDSVAFFRDLGDYAEPKGIRVGVETVGGEYDDYLSLIRSLDHAAVGATIDVGHCAYFIEVSTIKDMDKRAEVLNDVLVRLVHDVGEELFHFHLHNVRKYDWRDHRTVSEGVIDFPRLFAVISEVGYSGIFDIELEEPEMEKACQISGGYLSRLIDQFLPQIC